MQYKNKWYDVYGDLANHLNDFYEQYKEQAGEQFFKRCMQYEEEFFNLIGFAKKFNDKGACQSFDPIHIFASFNNYKIHPEIRKAKLLFYYKILHANSDTVEGADLDVFPFFPHFELRKIVGMRPMNAQQEIWAFFNSLCGQEQKNIEHHFNKTSKTWYGVGLTTLTTFMFWAFSDQYLPLDRNTKALLNEHQTLFGALDDYKTYMVLNSRGEGLGENIYRLVTHYAYKSKTDVSLSDTEMLKVLEFLDGIELKDFDEEFEEKVKKALHLSPEKREVALKAAELKPVKQKVQTTVFKRNPYVVAAVIEKANGVCAHCRRPAPFCRPDGSPFLEVHHEIPLAKGGLDSVENAVALCPNCHRKAHFG